MGVRIIHDREDDYAALYCSTTMTAFGDVFSGEEKLGLDAGEVANRFLAWLEANKHTDARRYDADEFGAVISEWWGAPDRFQWEWTDRGLARNNDTPNELAKP